MNPFVLADGPAVPEGLLSAFTTRKAAPAQDKRVAFKAIGSTPEGIIVGIGAAAGDKNKLDLDGEFFSKADLVKMAHDFCAARDRTFKANHKKAIGCDLVSSWPGAPIIKDGNGVRTLKASETLTDEMHVVGIDITKGKETHWFVAARPKDAEVAALAAKGGVAGFSVGVLATRVEV